MEGQTYLKKCSYYRGRKDIVRTIDFTISLFMVEKQFFCVISISTKIICHHTRIRKIRSILLWISTLQKIFKFSLLWRLELDMMTPCVCVFFGSSQNAECPFSLFLRRDVSACLK